ncbi:PRTRC system protein E [Paraburkholderia mimosarum]|uniref:PRTRC system protein E n=1 Tax=Paraburkholderia mimosarum TaxID=312026 RepID=UPI0039C33BA5
MSLFQSLFPLARENALTILIVAEGDQLRVNVMPKSKDEKAQKTLYPLSLLGSPDELDEHFAEAVRIYAPHSQSVLDQARAASEANGNSSAAPALPAPDAAPAPAKGKPGRKPKNVALPAPTVDAAGDAISDPNKEADNAKEVEGQETAQEVDPRQTSIPGLDDAAAAASAGDESNTGAAAESEAAAAIANAETAEDDGAVDLL